MTRSLPTHAAVAFLETGWTVELVPGEAHAELDHPALKNRVPLDAQQMRRLADALLEACLMIRGIEHRDHVPNPTRARDVPENFRG